MPDASPGNVSAVIIVGGEPIDAAVLGRLPSPRYVIAADSGLDHALALGLQPDVVIGDMDSVGREVLDAAVAAGVPVERHPRDKDATDLELAFQHAQARGHDHAVLLGGYGGRLSHMLGNALALVADALSEISVEWHVNAATVYVVRHGAPLTVRGGEGDLVSLLAAGGPAEGVTTSGLRWRLDDEDLAPGSTRGISNRIINDRATVALRRGVVLAVHERTHP